jgi:UBX domain-containing protein 1
MNVQAGQVVDVEIKQHEGNYVKPKAKYKPFGGQGTRLGSPTPGDGLTASVPVTTAPTSTSATVTATAATNEQPQIEIDESQPVIRLQVRLGNGNRLSSRFNTTHTVGHVYSFVTEASPDSQNRGWVLMTTFPSTELTDHGLALGDIEDLKKGGVLVQKWK